jgi:hypothetical protein
MSITKLTQLSNDLIARYENTRRTDIYEPSWILDPYNLAYDFIKNKCNNDQVNDYINELQCMNVPDGTTIESFPFPPRIFHDGYKVGSTSWIFMGRKNSPIYATIKPDSSFYYQDEIIVIGRKLPPQIAKCVKMPHPELEPIAYCGYSMNPRIAIDIGPCLTLEEIYNTIQGHGKVTYKPFNI